MPTIQEQYEEDYLIFAAACSELALPSSYALPPAGRENHNAARLYIAEKFPTVSFGAVISRDYYLLGIADLKKAGALKSNASETSNRPKNFGVMFSDREDAAAAAIPDSQFEDPRLAHNRRVDEQLSLVERRAMQGAGQIETARHPDAGIVGLKSEDEQVIRAGRVSYGETERLRAANREHNNRLRAEHAATRGKK
jgi:hypothetical protein